MTYEEAKVYLEETAKYGSVLGLDSIRNLLDYLQHPERDLKMIHAAGTNGKGSTIAYLLSILRNAGYRIGRYSSPVVFHAREHMQVDGENITEQQFAEETERLQAVLEQMKKDGQEMPTMFELETAMACVWFRRMECDLVLLETGLGGLEDATNVIERPELCVITPIAMDHMAYLGDTLEAIARQKAGILKNAAPVVSAVQQAAAADVLVKRACELEVPIRFVKTEALEIADTGTEKQQFSYRDHRNMEIRMAGAFQIENAALALEAVSQLRASGWDIPDQAVRDGLRGTEWPGRLEKIGSSPAFYIDGAHNVSAVIRLKEFIERDLKSRKIIMITGVFADKQYDKMAEIIAGCGAHIITTAAPDNPRALDAEKLKNVFLKYNKNCVAAADVAQAVEESYRNAGPDDVILAFGSLAYLHIVKDQVRERRDG